MKAAVGFAVCTYAVCSRNGSRSLNKDKVLVHH